MHQESSAKKYLICTHCGNPHQFTVGISAIQVIDRWGNEMELKQVMDDGNYCCRDCEKEATWVDEGKAESAEWSGTPDPDDPDNFWIDDVTGERVNAKTGERTKHGEANDYCCQSLAPETLLLLERQRAYAGKERLSPQELKELSEINAQLEPSGLHYRHPDEEYSRYLRLRHNTLCHKFGANTPEELAQHSMAMPSEEREELAKRLIQDLLTENYPASLTTERG